MGICPAPGHKIISTHHKGVAPPEGGCLGPAPRKYVNGLAQSAVVGYHPRGEMLGNKNLRTWGTATPPPPHPRPTAPDTIERIGGGYRCEAFHPMVERGGVASSGAAAGAERTACSPRSEVPTAPSKIGSTPPQAAMAGGGPRAPRVSSLARCLAGGDGPPPPSPPPPPEDAGRGVGLGCTSIASGIFTTVARAPAPSSNRALASCRRAPSRHHGGTRAGNGQRRNSSRMGKAPVSIRGRPTSGVQGRGGGSTPMLSPLGVPRPEPRVHGL